MTKLRHALIVCVCVLTVITRLPFGSPFNSYIYGRNHANNTILNTVYYTTNLADSPLPGAQMLSPCSEHSPSHRTVIHIGTPKFLIVCHTYCFRIHFTYTTVLFSLVSDSQNN